MSYLTNATDSAAGFSAAPAVAAAGLGVAVFTAVEQVIRGRFETRTATVNYVHPGTPPSLRFRPCVREFLISAIHARPFWSPQQFWFRLSFEYNGHDLRNITIVPLVDRSSTMTTSTFSITFAGLPHSVPQDPVAEVNFQISGEWDPHGPGLVQLWGNLFVRADGQVRLNVTSERRWVRHERITGSCPIIRPAPPPPRRPPIIGFWEIIFSPPGSARIQERGERDLVTWYRGLAQPIRRAIEAGRLPLRIDGYASTTQPGPANRELSRRRAEVVKRILQDVAGSRARFAVFAHGEYRARTPDRVESAPERRVRVSFSFQP